MTGPHYSVHSSRSAQHRLMRQMDSKEEGVDFLRNTSVQGFKPKLRLSFHFKKLFALQVN